FSTMKRLLLFSSICFLTLQLFVACGGGEDKTDGGTTTTDTTSQAPPAKNVYTLTPFTESVNFPDAAIKSMDYKGGKFTYSIGGTNYKLGEQTPDAPQKMCANSKEGQHIHLIVDDSPYVAKYVPVFDHKIADGDHFICSFLSRSYHESLKHKAASRVQKVSVKNGGFTKTEDVKDPMLFYSRPKGAYVGKAETDKVMLDFYLANAELGLGKYTVKVEVNSDTTFLVDKWQPYYIEGLPMGDNKIKLTLIDREGTTIETPLNPVERVFTLKPDPAEGQ
ncbi:MAG: phosphopeptide-binding protein, partial [Bacteroidota bacterium]